MNAIRVLIATALTCLASSSFAQTRSRAISVEMPTPPDPVGVTLDPARTAVLVSDMIGPICGAQPNCTGGVVAKVAALLSKARGAKAHVLYTIARPGASILPAVAPAAAEPTFLGHGQDRFFHTDLDALLKARNVTTLIIVGWKIDGSVLYTSVGATLRGYTVVVPVDASSAPADYEVPIGKYMILNQSSANAANAPLKPKASTLTRADLITFK